MSYDDYDSYGGYDGGSNKSKRSKKRSRLGFLAGLAAFATIAVRYPTAAFFLAFAVVFWLFTFMSGIANILGISGAFDLSWYVLCMAIPFFSLAVPGFLLVMAYEEGRSQLASNPKYREMFNNKQLFISNSAIMVIVSLITIGIAVGNAAGMVDGDSSTANTVVWTGMSIFAPLLCYASARLTAAAVK